MIRTRTIVTLMALSGTALAHPAGQTVRVPGGSYSQVSPQRLYAQLNTKDFILINVHVPYEDEFQRTDLSVSFNQIESAPALPREKNAGLVIYCRSSRMSALAARALVRGGYTNVRELRGGMNAWTAAGCGLKFSSGASLLQPTAVPTVSSPKGQL
ncbi:rhodanese-like domain-containing protein [Deinococcus humi]|uniref:Rhodanese-related sulfurtransferase n=1 Tax=Deinococcus humi TaxID=662880 RepID=A0A7W8NGD7_9DEIO|nr:rhodanese-like domain-containing protein [Deinococcus humi]MBB5366404.1 rhodanese-related sulfurtransferase [Deinococcus humi]GGO41585.1 hypothetical protein GCM10008949_52650 [Deinococcus humi]